MKDNNKVQCIDPTILVNEYGDYLYRFAKLRVHDQSTAEDLVQETLLAALASKDTYLTASSTRTWLTGILKHKIVDHFRRSVRFVLNDTDQDEDEFFDSIGHWRTNNKWSRTPESLYESKELGLIILKCLGRLKPSYAAVFTLREIDGLSRQEVCDALAISDSNYWVLLHRARLHLRNEIQKSRCRETKNTTPGTQQCSGATDSLAAPGNA